MEDASPPSTLDLHVHACMCIDIQVCIPTHATHTRSKTEVAGKVEQEKKYSLYEIALREHLVPYSSVK